MTQRTLQELQMLQALPLEVKVAKTKQRIREWVDHFGEDGVYVSFSGGKDSTALLSIVRELYPNIVGVFCDTGLEYPEIRDFVKNFDNIDWIKPKMNFKEVIKTKGYPFASKEVSECIEGARKYLLQLATDGTILTDRQTDRQRLITPYYAQCFRRLNGLGEYAKRTDEASQRREQSKTGNHAWAANERADDKGEYP